MTKILKLILSKNHRLRVGGNYANSSITIHGTGNPKSTAQNERDWLDNPSNNRSACWHYVVDESMIIQAVPDEEEAWHCGEQAGNRTSISIEICESGDRRKTLENAAEFVAMKLKYFGWGIEQIMMHNDWTGKNCPRILIDEMYIKDGLDWNWFIKKVMSYMKGVEEVQEKRFQTLAEIPDWGKDIIQTLVEKNCFADKNHLDLSYDMLRIFVILELLDATYDTIEEVPSWGQATIQKLVDKGVFSDVKNLNLSEDMLRIFVINDRLGIYG